MLTRFLNQLGAIIDLMLAFALALMVVLVFGNVVLRYGFNSGITTSEELSRWLFVWLTFLGAIVAMKDGAHLGTDTLVSRLPLRGKQVFFVLSHGLMLYACWLLWQGAWNLVQINLSATSAVMEISMAYFYACGMVLAVSGGPAGASAALSAAAGNGTAGGITVAGSGTAASGTVFRRRCPCRSAPGAPRSGTAARPSRGSTHRGTPACSAARPLERVCP